MKQDAPVSL